MPLILPASLTEARCRRHGWWWLLLLAALLYLPGLGTLPLMDRDEPRFAHATVEMIQRETWVVPYFNGVYRFDKPPLTYWWMRLHYGLFGVNEYAARLHSIVAAWAVALVLAGLGRRLAGARAGMLAGGAWLLTLQVLVHGRLCVADMPMVLFVALAMRAILELLLMAETAPSAGQSFNRWHGLLYLALGLGFLAKGPIAWLIPALALVLYRWVFWRQPVAWSVLKLGPGALIVLAIIAVWGIPALIETHGLYWQVGMGEHVIARGTSALNGRFPVPGYYFITALASLFPWIALLPQVVLAVRRQWSARIALIVSWLLAPYVIFTFYATQLAHYVMPGFPAAMLLLAVCGADTTGPRWHRWWSGLVVGLFVVLALAVVWGSTLAGLPEPLRPLLWHGVWLLATLSILAGLIVLRVYRGARSHSLWLGLAVLSLPWPLVNILQDLRDLHPASQLARELGPGSSKAKLLACQFTEPSLVFHFDHEWKFTNDLRSAKHHLERTSPTITVLLRREWTLSRALRDQAAEHDNAAEVEALIAAFPKHQVVRFTGFNGARSSWVELVALVQH